MLNPSRLQYTRQHGTSLVEVLVTLVILAFGLLGVAGLQAKMSLAELES
jgi:type IV pilus assembly protein PilV